MPHKDPEARRAYQRAYRERNEVALRERRHQRYRENTELFKERNRRYYEENKDAIGQQQKEYREENLESRRECGRDHYKKNRHKYNAWKKSWRRCNGDRLRTQNRERRRNDVHFRLGVNLRVRLWAAIKNGQRKGSAVRDLGMSIPEFQRYIESKFRDGMTWDNWGTVWQMDHLKPIAAFDLTIQEQLLQACHYTNLQPLLVEENLRKGSKWDAHSSDC